MRCRSVASVVMREMIQYHRAREADEGLRWLRRQLLAAAQAQP